MGVNGPVLRVLGQFLTQLAGNGPFNAETRRRGDGPERRCGNDTSVISFELTLNS